MGQNLSQPRTTCVSFFSIDGFLMEILSFMRYGESRKRMG